MGESGSSSLRSPEYFAKAELLVADFDGTTHNTFEPPEGGVGLDEAYRISISRVFDFHALEKYDAEGEHRNRTPSEIVHSLAPDCTDEGLGRLTEELVKTKLELLSGQIGEPLDDSQIWPRPMEGFLEFWNSVQTFGQEREFTTAILSAGHESFIRKVFDAQDLMLPDIMVTEETMRGLNSIYEPYQLAKPQVMPMLLAKVQWLNFYGLDITSEQVDSSVNERITMFGDSKEKDGGLARNSGAHFVHISPEDPAAGYEELSRRLNLGQTALKQTVRSGS